MASLYLHIPFCEHKCIYCDFYSIEHLNGITPFLASLKKEIEMYGDYGAKEEVETIFFGGGTPSLLAPQDFEKIFKTIRTAFSIHTDAEITVETNPGTVTRSKLRDYFSLGINRLSFGVQSFHEDDLRFMTRIHSVDEAKRSICDAQEVGFSNINLDLIFSLPNQTLDRWKKNLEEALALRPQHISAYSLIIEPQTPLARMVQSGSVTPLPSEADAELYEYTMKFMADHGYEHYEVSNYALPGFNSRHNSNYWNHSNYLGFGPSAHSFWDGRRWWNISNIQNYRDRILRNELPVADSETLNQEELLDEAIMLGLRSNGIDFHQIRERTGFDLFASASSFINQLVTDRLAKMEARKLRLTERGFLVCDEISKSLAALH